MCHPGKKLRIVELTLRRDTFGNTPLHHAAVNGHVSTISLLTERSAVINSKNRDGMTPLTLAAKKGRTTSCEALIQKGAIVNVANSEQWYRCYL